MSQATRKARVAPVPDDNATLDVGFLARLVVHARTERRSLRCVLFCFTIYCHRVIYGRFRLKQDPNTEVVLIAFKSTAPFCRLTAVLAALESPVGFKSPQRICVA